MRPCYAAVSDVAALPYSSETWRSKPDLLRNEPVGI